MPFYGDQKAVELFRGKKAVDPVCQMEVAPEKAAASYVYQGTAYYFCAVGCKKQFEKDPEKYLKGSPHPEMS